MIFQFTGQPGHGKTVLAIEKLLEFKAKGRTCFAVNVKDFNYEKTGVESMTPEEFKAWPANLPDGSVVLVDECYQHGMLPKRGPSKQVPRWVEELAIHRHRGLDFIFVCQSPDTQMDSFVHDLIEEHYHIRRRYGLPFVHVRRFDKFERNPEKTQPLTIQRRRYPKHVFKLYTSTKLDTSERRIPWFYYAAWGLGAFVLIFGVYTVYRVKSRFDPDVKKTASGQAAGSAAHVAGAVGGVEVKWSVKDEGAEYLAAHKARVPAMPWTAPVFDQRSVASKPEVYCMSSEAGYDAQGEWREASQNCKTEQGTQYRLPIQVARTIARFGPGYNAYREPSAQGAGAALQSSAAVETKEVDPPESVSVSKPDEDKHADVFPRSPAYVDGGMP